MQRVLFTISARDQGWQLYEGEQGRFWFNDRAEALHTAGVIANNLHLQHGIRSAVIMDMAGREAVLVSRHG
ncbi:hypothetical protein SAMN05428989_2989 [Pseudoxanthomonas sp. GM95]|uniref:hypothetical protein n=1 Tax=Pseudoxanthomonas sp. GM95 TaxID=1881043 RepID=UPI0008C9F5AC|nr:hypothetical protein [Pseudoxanthomonas sp. GM95]SEM07976.1 hypothetical protein SAMN05428989_2989 [Pseudoxanthomonas sp. GM95]